MDSASFFLTMEKIRAKLDIINYIIPTETWEMKEEICISSIPLFMIH